MKNRPTIQLNDIVIIGDGNRSRSSWRLVKVEKLIESNDKQIRGAIVRVSKTNKLVTRPVNKLYLVERFSCEDIDVSTNKSPREAAVIGELKRKYSPFRRTLLRYFSLFGGSVWYRCYCAAVFYFIVF